MLICFSAFERVSWAAFRRLSVASSDALKERRREERSGEVR
jgi:hypothetical protein